MPRPTRLATALALALIATVCSSRGAQPARPATDPTPQTIDEFQAVATRILQETGVPGAGIALVRQEGVEWEGGVGLADRDERTPVTADTHFRVGSISKTFVAMALVQLSEDGVVDLDATVEEIAPEIAIENPWRATDPVRVIHLLQHTAGFDDMHFNELYVANGEPELSMEEVLQRNPHSRRVRWKPGTRMAYSNPGYGVAGVLLEKLAGEPYEDYIQREIFDPLEMTTSSFRLAKADEHLLARGYSGPTGPPVGYPQIYLRPAGNLHSSPREMARFVRMLLGWGEVGTAFVIDPEYLGTMEQPRTTLAATAGLRNGYGTGIYTTLDLPYRVLGHGGGIDGFSSTYAYSPSRDVGYVILLNSAGAGNAMNRLSSLALSYLKRDVEPATTPEARIDAATLDQYTGYYHDANPRNQVMWPVQWVLSGRTIVRDGEALYAEPVVGTRARLIPVTEASFRLENEIDASRVFTRNADGIMVVAGPDIYAERMPRWRAEILRVPLLATSLIVMSVLLVAIMWIVRIRRAEPRGFWTLKLAMLLCPVMLLIPVAVLAVTPAREWGAANAGAVAVFLASLGVPSLALIVPILALGARREGASPSLTTYACFVALAMIGLSVYFGAHGLLGLRTWSY